MNEFVRPNNVYIPIMPMMPLSRQSTRKGAFVYSLIINIITLVATIVLFIMSVVDDRSGNLPMQQPQQGGEWALVIVSLILAIVSFVGVLISKQHRTGGGIMMLLFAVMLFITGIVIPYAFLFILLGLLILIGAIMTFIPYSDQYIADYNQKLTAMQQGMMNNIPPAGQ